MYAMRVSPLRAGLYGEAIAEERARFAVSAGRLSYFRVAELILSADASGETILNTRLISQSAEKEESLEGDDPGKVDLAHARERRRTGGRWPGGRTAPRTDAGRAVRYRKGKGR